MATDTVSRQEVEAIRTEIEELSRDLKHVRAEYEIADDERGKGKQTEVEHLEWDAKLVRMHDADVVASYIMITSLLHQRLSGTDWDLMRGAKGAAIEMWSRFLTEEGHEALRRGFEVSENDGEFDLSYLDA